MNPHDISKAFESELCKYTGSPYAVAVDSGASAMFLALMYEGVKGKTIHIPSNTYMSVPCAIIHAGGKLVFYNDGPTIKGSYQLMGTHCIDSALHFTHGMYRPGTFMCLSFTGPYKHLKLGKGGAILTDNKEAYDWFIKARFNGRNNVSYHHDTFDMLGWNMYMAPQIAAMGLHMMAQFYVNDKPIDNEEAKASELREEDILSFVKNKYGREIDSFEDIFSDEPKEDLPEDVATYLKFKNDTGRGINDFVK